MIYQFTLIYLFFPFQKCIYVFDIFCLYTVRCIYIQKNYKKNCTVIEDNNLLNLTNYYNKSLK